MAFPRPGAGGGSIDTIQNTDGTVTVVDGAGPTTTVSVASGKFLPLAGGTMSGHIDMGGGRIVDASAAINPTDVPIFSQVSGGGGSTLAVAELLLEVTHPVYASFPGSLDFTIDTANGDPPNGCSTTATFPLFSTAPAGTVITFGSLSIPSIDTTNFDYEISVALEISNLDGSEFMNVNGTVTASSGAPGDTATLATTDLSVTSQTGTDLAYDSATGIVSTTAGGSFGVIAQGAGIPS